MADRPSPRDGKAVALMGQLSGLGFALVLEGGDIVISPASRLTPKLRAEIATNKAAIVRVLATDRCARCEASWWVLASVGLDGRRVCAACVLRRRRAFGRLISTHGGNAA